MSQALRSLLANGRSLAAAISSGQTTADAAREQLLSLLADQPPASRDTLVSHLSQQYDHLLESGASFVLEYAFLVRDAAEAFGSQRMAGWTNHDLGKLLSRRGRARDAEAAFRRALAAWGNDFPEFCDVVIGDLGGALRLQNRLREAEPLLRRALAAAERDGNLHNRLQWHLELANCLCFQGRNREAEEVAKQGLELAVENDRPSSQSALLTALANVRENQGRYDECRNLHERALALSREINSPAAEATDRQNLGNLCLRLQRYDEALAHYEEGVRLAAQAGAAETVVALYSGIGWALLERQDLAAAHLYLDAGLRAARELGVTYHELRILTGLARLHLALGEVTETKALMERSAELSRGLGEAPSLVNDLVNLARLHLEAGEIEAAKPLIAEALETVEPLEDPYLHYLAEARAADLAVALGEGFEEVWPRFERAMAALEEPRQHVRKDLDRMALYGDRHRRLYRSAAGFALSSRKADLALEVAERGKARLLSDALEERVREQVSSPLPAAALWRRVQALPRSTAVVSLFQTEGEVLLFRLDRDAEVVDVSRHAVSEEHLGTWLDAWSALLAKSGPVTESSAAVLAQLRELEDAFVGSLRSWLRARPGIEHVVLVPYGLLHDLPIHLAVDAESKRHLCEEVGCSYLPAIQLLQGAASPSGSLSPLQPQDVLVVDDPSLKGAGEEAAAVAWRFGCARLSGEAATAEAVAERVKGVRLLHLACHGRFEPGAPEASHLLLPGSGPLTVLDISAWELPRLDLVVAAACQSGKTKPVGLDEALGLTRGWLLAGAGHVLSALWNVKDVPSARFMDAFYDRLQRGEGYADAFRAAQAALRNGSPLDRDPRTWGAFTLTSTQPRQRHERGADGNTG